MRGAWLILSFVHLSWFSLLVCGSGSESGYNSIRAAYYLFGEELPSGSADGYLKRAAADQKAISLTSQLASAPLQVMGNTVQLQQVFVNLIQNSLNSCEEHGKITVRTWETGDEIIAEVADNGRGMAFEQSEHAFEPFFTTRTHEGGTGLGLSIVHGIVSDHEGTVELQSELGKGTQVLVRFPKSAGDLQKSPGRCFG